VIVNDFLMISMLAKIDAERISAKLPSIVYGIGTKTYVGCGQQ